MNLSLIFRMPQLWITLFLASRSILRMTVIKSIINSTDRAKEDSWTLFPTTTKKLSSFKFPLFLLCSPNHCQVTIDVWFSFVSLNVCNRILLKWRVLACTHARVAWRPQKDLLRLANCWHISSTEWFFFKKRLLLAFRLFVINEITSNLESLRSN